MGVRVRWLAPEDWAVSRDVRLRALRDSPDAFRVTYEDAASRDERGWRDWIAGAGFDGRVGLAVAELDDGAPVGTAGLILRADDPGVGLLYAMWVAPEHRGTGIGRTLVREVESRAVADGCTELRLRVTDGSAAAGFYSACGYVGTGSSREPLRDASPLMTVGMRRPLTPGDDAEDAAPA